MSIFASKTPRDLNPHGVIMTGSGTLPLCLCGWQRRRLDGPTLAEHIAEFDHVQSNEPNPILVEYRRTVALGADQRGMAQVFVNSINWGADLIDQIILDADPDRDLPRSIADAWADHARRVLTRLANLAQIGA